MYSKYIIEYRSPPPPCVSWLQEVWHQVRRLLGGHLPQRPGAPRAEQGVPPGLLHLRHVQQAAVHGRGAVRPGRAQVHLQGGLPEQPGPRDRAAVRWDSNPERRTRNSIVGTSVADRL